MAARRTTHTGCWTMATTCALLVAAVRPCAAQQPGGTPLRLSKPQVAVAQPWPSDTSWRHIGPAAFGGRIDDIEAVASDPRIIFVGTASGGIFRSTNNGVTWDPVFDKDAGTLSIGDIAIAPGNPQIVWAGTGEANNRNSSTWGDGVYRSRDGGTTWQHMGLRETQTIGRIVIDPRNPDIVFVAAVGHLFGPNEERGLYRTKDGGATWQKVLAVDANTGATDVVITPDGRTLLAATYQRRRRAFGFAGSGPGSGLWRSTDGGDTWQRVTNGMPAGELGRIGLDISLSNPDIVYAVIEAAAPGAGVYRSSDRGATWVRQNALNPRPNYFSQIRVDTKNPDRVWLLGVALAVSHDGGRTFSDDSIADAHADHHAMWIDPQQPDHIMLGNDGGVYFSYDRARTWHYIDNLPIGQFYDITTDNREPYWIYGGAQDNGSWAFPSSTYSRGGMTNADAINTGFGDGFQAAVDPLEPRFVYANSQNGRAFLHDLRTREEHFIQPLAPTGQEAYRFNWNTPIQLSPNDAHVLYMGAQKLLETTDRGQTWQEISPDLTKHTGRGQSVGAGFPAGRSLSANDGVGAYGNITTISESPKAAGTIYVGTDDGNVQLSTDGGLHWTDVTARFGLAQPRYVSNVLASRHDARVAYVSFDGHWDDDMKPYVFRTGDGGATWQPITTGIPGWKSVRTLAEDSRNPELLFAGTEFGLYWSTDGGQHWSPATGNVPPVRIDKIIVHPRTNDLILGTHGRSVIILDDIGPMQARNIAAKGPVQLFPVRAATEVQTYRDLPWPSSDEFVARNAPVGTYITYRIATDARRAGSANIEVLDGSGAIVSRMTGSAAKGTHRVLWDLRYDFPYVPPPADSGFYGPPRAPYVPPGDYTVRLTARGSRLTQPVQVRTDARAAGTQEALRMRTAMNLQARELSRVYYDLVSAIDSASAELTSLRPLAKGKPAADSALAAAATQLAALRQSARGRSILSGIGRVFDITAALESSSLPPTDAQQRSMAAARQELTDLTAKFNDFLTKTLPSLRSTVGRPAATNGKLVRGPE